MKGDDQLETMSQAERDDWLRWRQRGRFRFWLLLWGVLTASLTAGLFLLGFFVDVWPELPLGLRLLASFVIAGVVSAPLSFVVGRFIWNVSERRYDTTVSGRSRDVNAWSRRKDLALYVLTLSPLLLMFFVGMWDPEWIGPGGFCLFLGVFGLGLAFRIYANKTGCGSDQTNAEGPQRDRAAPPARDPLQPFRQNGQPGI
jgi:hypothetical protein